MPKRFKKDAVAAVMAAATLMGTGPGQTPKVTASHAQRHTVNTPATPRRGRPRKFSRPSRAVTLTLPEDVIATLRTIDSDLGRAIVRAIQPLEGKAPRPPAELTMYGGRAVIIVPRNRALIDRTGVELVPLTDGRALISFDQRTTVSQFELRIMDALADPSFDGADRVMFQALAEILRGARQTTGVSLRQRSIIVLHWTKPGAGDADEGADSDAEFV
jgi:hypothetical protein